MKVNPFTVKNRNPKAGLVWLNAWCFALLVLAFTPPFHKQWVHHPHKVWLWLPVLTVAFAVVFALIGVLARERRSRRYYRIMKRL